MVKYSSFESQGKILIGETIAQLRN